MTRSEPGSAAHEPGQGSTAAAANLNAGVAALWAALQRCYSRVMGSDLEIQLQPSKPSHWNMGSLGQGSGQPCHSRVVGSQTALSAVMTRGRPCRSHHSRVMVPS